MLRVGITGQAGFIGSHLYNYLGLYPEEFIRIPFKDEYFQDIKELQNFVSKCNIIVHLAALNRHNNPQTIYETNVDLVKKLLTALETTRSTPQVIFASSTQEIENNLYGKSKFEGRITLAEWAEKNNSLYTGMIIPNVFGPFGNPYYNSVVATFCHQLTHGEVPEIHIDKKIPLIYINNLVKEIINCIKSRSNEKEYWVQHDYEINVSELLEQLKMFKEIYFDKNRIPNLNNSFAKDLFNTYRSYIDKKHYPVNLQKYEDQRGYLVVTMQEETGGQSFFSITKSGITRGNHFHICKIERFCVLKGKASIKLRRIGTEDVIEYIVTGDQPVAIDMPVWFTHNITNIGEKELVTLFWSSVIFEKDDGDTFYEEV